MDDSTTPPVGSTTPTIQSALLHPWSHLRFWLTAGAVLVLDLVSKHWVFHNLPPNKPKLIVPYVVEFRRSLNDGAVFGVFTGQVTLFIVASLVALVFVFYLFARSPRSFRGLHIALACILAGALGNLYDRAFMKADIVTYRTSNGKVDRTIGTIVSESEHRIELGQWPEGTHPRPFARAEVAIRQQGVVRDFIKFVPKFPAWVPKLGRRDMWPWVFNVADAALVCGVGALLCTSWLRREPH